MSTLLLEFWTEKHDFCIYAEAGDYEKEITLSGQAKEIVAHFTTIYDILEENQQDQASVLQTSLEWLSQRLIAPFTQQIKACSLVRFVVYEDLIRCAFDLLLFEDSYLFLQRSVCYQVDEGVGEDAPSIEIESALLIADLTADPEEACLAVSKLIPETEYATVEDAEAVIKPCPFFVAALLQIFQFIGMARHHLLVDKDMRVNIVEVDILVFAEDAERTHMFDPAGAVGFSGVDPTSVFLMLLHFGCDFPLTVSTTGLIKASRKKATAAASGSPE